MVHFHNLDSLQHRMWPYFDVDDTGLREAGFDDAVERSLRALDDAIGRLLELASQRDAAIVVASDHGFGPCRSLVNINGMLRMAGLQRSRVYGTRFRYRAIRMAERLRRRRDPAARRFGTGQGPTDRRSDILRLEAARLRSLRTVNFAATSSESSCGYRCRR